MTNHNGDEIMNLAVPPKQTLDERKAAYAKKIFERLQEEAPREGLEDKEYQYFQEIHPQDLQTIIEILVECANIPLPPSGVYSDDVHAQVRAYVNEAVDCYAVLERKQGRARHFRIGTRGMEFQPGRDLVDQEFHAVDNCGVALCRKIHNLDALISLALDDCYSVPDLSRLKRLETLRFISGSLQYEDENGVFVPSTLPSLKRLYIDDRDGQDTSELGRSLLLWLEGSKLSSLEKLRITVRGTGQKVVPSVFQALQKNKSVSNLLAVEIDASNATFTADNYFADLFLDSLPQVCPKLKQFTFLADFQNLFPAVIKRLKEGRYHPTFPSTICKSLQELHLKTTTCDGSYRLTFEDMSSMITILKWFKQLHVVPVDFCTQMTAKSDLDIDYLLRVNYGGGRVLIPETASEASGHPNLGSLEVNNCIPPQSEQQRAKPRPIPPSLWPFVLARANKDPCRWSKEEDCLRSYMIEDFCRDRDATAIYRLLRPNARLLGPALEGILEQHTPQTNDDKKEGGDSLTHMQAKRMLSQLITHSKDLGVGEAGASLLTEYGEILRAAKEKHEWKEGSVAEGPQSKKAKTT